MKSNYSIYGILISLAIFICLVIAEKRAKKASKPVAQVWDIGLTALLCGLVGARAYHVIDLWEYYSVQPIKILYFWQGGLGIWGGLVGGLAGTWIYLKLKREPSPLYWLDLFAGILPLGQAIGRWGNYFNQENYGLPTNILWKIFIDPARRFPGYENVAYYHPLFLYESILNLVLFILLGVISKRYKYGSGYIMLFYLMGYSFIRFGLDFLRIEFWQIRNVSVSQAVALLTICICLLVKSRMDKEAKASFFRKRANMP